MAPPLVTIDAAEPIEKIIEIIEKDGGVIISNFLSPDLLKETMDAIEPHFKGRKITIQKLPTMNLVPSSFPRDLSSLLSKIPVQLTKIVRLSVWKSIMAHFLNDEFSFHTGETLVPQKSGYMLASTATLRLIPGAKPQPLHRATAVIPGSHLWGADRAPKKEECTYAEMEPGSALFTLGSTYHGAGENKCEHTDPEALRTLIAVFAPDQDEVLSTPIEIARKLPEDVLRLAGYYKAVSGVGYVQDQHPIEMMDISQ
ncbi:conserved hypothetical protein [Talaromyces stipitatus ATCC 10500]|uniref:Phytanoyl-CoA dioxygenase family protein n=1 Tax=Talaromyces stipitatus (strain ATCC 10500 / CBS 375.48 / QM 6759 / NRRL 1006) TaxID=441959 RepID=B8LX04_TALSN|nr:uncharacterized protein TSTA_079920 [Talaromyces stipitatus ATCC 10500]EED24637.1 conserved hypothetical protein [Talaromyces stipitatus ATCC 10500]